MGDGQLGPWINHLIDAIGMNGERRSDAQFLNRSVLAQPVAAERRHGSGRFAGHQTRINALVFPPDGRSLVSAGADGDGPGLGRALPAADRRSVADRIHWVQPMCDSSTIVTRVLHRIRRAGAVGLVLAACLATSCRGKAPYRNKSIAALEEMLRSSDPTTQVQGAYGLGVKGAEARSAVPSLTELLRNPNVLVRQNAALALGKIGPAASQAVPDLIATLGDQEWTVRRQAAMALGEIGPEARPAVAQLQKLRGDRQPFVRRAAEEALARIAPSASPPGKR